MAIERCPYCGNTVFVETPGARDPGRICAGALGCHAPVARHDQNPGARTEAA
jgi:hypothetical protein